MDWSVKSTLSETLEVNDNRQMRANPLGDVVQPVDLARCRCDRADADLAFGFERVS